MAQGFASAIGGAVQLGLKAIENGMYSSGGGTNLKDSLALMDAQSTHWRSNTEWYNNNILPDAYVRTRKALEKAGYNPLMGIGTPLADQGVMPNATATSGAKQMSISKQAFADATLKNLKQDTMLKGAQTEQQISSSNLLNQQKETEIYKTKLEELHTEMQEIENKIKNKDYDTYDLKLYNELRKTEIQLISAIAQKDQAYASNVSASAQQLQAKTQSIKAYKEKAMNEGIDFLKTNNWEKTAKDYLYLSNPHKPKATYSKSEMRKNARKRKLTN